MVHHALNFARVPDTFGRAEARPRVDADVAAGNPEGEPSREGQNGRHGNICYGIARIPAFDLTDITQLKAMLPARPDRGSDGD